MWTLNKIGGQQVTEDAMFDCSKSTDIENLPTEGVPNCSKAMDWEALKLYVFDGDTKTWVEK